jgi:hypothetical protein
VSENFEKRRGDSTIRLVFGSTSMLTLRIGLSKNEGNTIKPFLTSHV